MKAMLKTATGLALVAALAACGGGGGGSSSDAGSGSAETTLVTKANYVDVAGMTLVAGDRLKLLFGVVDLSFREMLADAAVPPGSLSGTYSCVGGGSLSYTKVGNTYVIDAAACSDFVDQLDQQPVLIQQGRIEVKDLVVGHTSSGVPRLASASVTFAGTALLERAAASEFNGTLAVGSTVTGPSTIDVTGRGDITVRRGSLDPDQYQNVDVLFVGQGGVGNQLSKVALSLVSPRSPVNPNPLALVFSVTSTGALAWEAFAPDGSGSLLATPDGESYTVFFVPGGNVGIDTSVQSTRDADPLASAITRALQ